MKKARPISILLCLSILFISCSTFCPGKYTAQLTPAQCLPFFPDQNGWYGGDGAYSIALDQQRTLWIFGDTFVSEDADRKDRIGMDVVLGTTLAVSTCADNRKFSIQYFLKKKDGKFTSSFGDGEWLWPQDPFIAGGALYIPLLVVENLMPSQAPFNFRITGHKIARIKDFSASDPRQWAVDYLDWSGALAPGIEALATTSIVEESYVYFYPLYRYAKDNIGISGNILARLSIDRLDNPAGSFEYWMQDGTWQKTLKPRDVKIIFPSGVSELSVRYHAAEQKWMAVYLSPESKGSHFLFSTAQNIEGPWSRPLPFTQAIAEVDPQSPLYHQDTFCYAGKEHQQFSSGRNLVVTYVCNSSEDAGNQNSFLRRNLFLYRPRVMIIQR